MRRFALVIVALLSVCAVRCTPANDPGAKHPSTCGGACENARTQCGPDMLRPRRDGLTCEDACFAAGRNGLDFKLACLANAKTCDAVKVCASTSP